MINVAEVDSEVVDIFLPLRRSLKFGVSIGDLQFAGLSFWKFTTVLQMGIAENCGAL